MVEGGFGSLLVVAVWWTISFWIGQKVGGQVSLPVESKRSDSSAPQTERGRIVGWATLAEAGVPWARWWRTARAPSARSRTVSWVIGRSLLTRTAVARSPSRMEP